MGVVTDTDNGYRELVERLYGLSEQQPSVSVGILEKDGDKEMKAGRPGHELTPKEVVTLLQAAIWVHFGTEDGHIPPRPFISGWFDANEKRLHEEFGVLMQSVVEGKRTAEQILELMGQRMVGEIQTYISRHGDGEYPENADATIKRKGSSTPLVNFGILRASISYKVNQGGEEE